MEASVPQFEDRSLTRLLQDRNHMWSLLNWLAPNIAQDVEAESLELMDSTLIPESLQKLDEDLVYEARLRSTDQDLGIIVLTAHQSYGDPLMPYRLHAAMARLYEQDLRHQIKANTPRHQIQLRHILPVLIYSGERAWSCPDLSSLFPADPRLSPHTPTFRVLEIDLSRCDAKSLREQGQVLGLLLSLYATQYEDTTTFVENFEAVLKALQAQEQNEDWLSEQLRFCIRFVLNRRNLQELDRLKDQVATIAPGEATKMGTIAESLRKEGWEAGLKEGREEAALKLVKTLLVAKFPNKTESEILDKLKQVKGYEALEALSVRLVTESNWDELWAS